MRHKKNKITYMSRESNTETLYFKYIIKKARKRKNIVLTKKDCTGQIVKFIVRLMKVEK